MRHIKTFANHKCQSHGNKHHRLRAVRMKDYMRSQKSWAYGDLKPLRSNMLPRRIIACILAFFFLERRLGNRNCCSLSKDRYAAYRGTNLLSSPFDCRANMK